MSIEVVAYKEPFIDRSPFLCYDYIYTIIEQKGVFSWKIRLKIDRKTRL